LEQFELFANNRKSFVDKRASTRREYLLSWWSGVML